VSRDARGPTRIGKGSWPRGKSVAAVAPDDPRLPDDRFRDGIRLFNEGYFFESHEVFEDIWHGERGQPRLFLQGLIQICAGFHHYQNGNYRGSAELLGRGTQKMRAYPDWYMGIDAAKLLRQVDEARAGVEGLRDGKRDAGRIEFPKITMTDSPE